MRRRERRHQLPLLLLALSACEAQTEPVADSPRSALDHPAIEPIGGGEGYGDWPAAPGAGTDNLEALRAALLDPVPGAVVTIADDARIVIEISDPPPACELTVPENVTVASGRGRDGELGALIASSSANRGLDRTAIFCLERGARVTGLRIQGPSLAPDWPGCGGGTTRAIAVTGDNDGEDLGVRIDNNEIYGWPVATAVTFASGVSVDHNHIHHNQRKAVREEKECRVGLGYGVVVSTGNEPLDGGPQAADAVIEANLFHHNRHDIASDGGRGASYTARYNVVHDARISHSFDVHQGDRLVPDGDPEPTGVAGERYEIAHNTFLQDNELAIKLRAVPAVGAYIYDNEFRHTSQGQAMIQVDDTVEVLIDPWENVTAWNNDFDIERRNAWFMAPGAASGPLNQGDETDDNGPSPLGGEGAPDDREPGFWTLRRFDDTPMYYVRFGDFDCDGTDDVFRKSGSRWQYSSGGRGDWVNLASSNASVWSLRFGDFDGNGCTDVFRANPSAGRWYVSWNGTSAWDELNTSGVGVEYLGFGDFNGDGSTDVFKANGSSWRVSLGGSSSWQFLASSSVRIYDLAFGDFNGDGKTDVFRATGSQWYVSLGGTSSWSFLNNSGIRLPYLGFGDFDGDGVTDVLQRSGVSGKWEVSWGATSSWEKTRTSSYYPWSLGFADLNGDGATDILSLQSVG